MANFVCHRGEDPDNWYPPEVRLIYGLTVRQPWPGVRPSDKFDVTKIWAELQKDIKQRGHENVNMYTQTLRQAGQPVALAFSREYDKAYSHKGNVYSVSIPGARTFRFAESTRNKCVPALGKEVDWVTDHAAIDDHYLVLNADSIAGSTVLGLGHRSSGLEVTFFTDLPRQWVTQVNKEPASDIEVTDLNKLDIDTRIKVQKLGR
ncbi:hypothetical protein ACN27F_14825 [Solwaraspora sp. WMMB335]|uniref:hypothetical protein n=1 Tax=Solwaraspora sp. WMMB335 TaxID=3404118 RepID=UPI003B937FDD